MTGLLYRCLNCKKGARYTFCSNACYREYAPKRRGIDCAICRYRGSKRAQGSSDGTRICAECRKDPANKGWRRTPRNERNGFDVDVFEAAAGGLEVREPRPFRGKKAVRIVRLIAGGMAYRDIALLVDCHLSYVKRVAEYWNQETDYMLKKIRENTNDS